MGIAVQTAVPYGLSTVRIRDIKQSEIQEDMSSDD